MKCKTERNFWKQDIRRKEYLQAILKGCLIIGAIAYLFYGNWICMILFSPYLIWYIRQWERQQIKKKKTQFQLQFKEAIQSLSTALNVGYSVENSLREVEKDLQTLYKKENILIKEIRLVVNQIDMNVPVERALMEFAKRTGDEDVTAFVTVFNMAKRSGGDTLEMIRGAAKQIGEKIDVEREIDTILSAKKFEFQIMTFVPLGMIAYLRLSFPEFTEVLYGNTGGVVIMSVCLLIYLIAYEAGRRMVEIEV